MMKAASAGSSSNAPNTLTRNMKASSTPMSAWNLRSENAQVATDTVIVTAVNSEAVPRCFSASTKACGRLRSRTCISCCMRSNR